MCQNCSKSLMLPRSGSLSFGLQVKSAKPGILSPDLREGLGMGDNTPPPWLINMQRYGPPPSYPDLKISGLNAPIPPGARFGYQPGGWGKPPVDESGEPLYGDVFGQYVEESDDEQARLFRAFLGPQIIMSNFISVEM